MFVCYVVYIHPKIKKGLSRGLAPRFYGPFTVVGVYGNGCDYLIKRAGQSKSRVRQVHMNNLKLYFKYGHPNDTIPADNMEQSQTQTKRTYKKDPLNTRWRTTIDSVVEDTIASENEESEIDKSQVDTSDDTERFESEAERDINNRKKTKRPYRKNPNNPRWSKNCSTQSQTDIIPKNSSNQTNISQDTPETLRLDKRQIELPQQARYSLRSRKRGIDLNKI